MHCSTHNIDYQCPACRAEEEAEYQRMMLELQRQAKAELQAQRRHVEILEIQRDEIDQRQSLGRYDCPFCLYRELKRGALSCPACNAEILPDQWRPIYEIERAMAKAWALAEPERQRQAEEAKQVAEAERTGKIYVARNWKMWLGV